MLRYFAYFLFFNLFGLFFSCTFEEEIITDSPEFSLSFSSDTISFDTLFTSRASVSKRLYVRNRNKNAVTIERIYLGRGNDSEFSIIINGIETTELKDQVILGNDSLLVLISVTIDPDNSSLPFIVKDSILFSFQNILTDIKLRSWGQNAVFLGDTIFSVDQYWSDEKPYYLYSSILVDSLVTLHINQGTKIYAQSGAYLYILGTLHCLGKPENRILFANERREQEYEQVPGQWGGIFFLEGSTDNLIEYTDIRNVEYGLRVGTPDTDTLPDLIVRNTRIENTTIAGVIAFTSDVHIENSLINTSAGFNLACLAGGNYRINHCTLANYVRFSIRNQPSVVFSDNVILEDGSIINEDLSIDIFNSLIMGTLDEEIIFDGSGGSEIFLRSGNSIFKSTLNFLEEESNLLISENGNTLFADIDQYDYSPDSLSVAIDYAAGSDFEIDLFGNSRDSLPDAGAIEFLK